jgi:xylulokinase
VRRLPADLRATVLAVGLSSHRGGVVPMDGAGRPLARCMIGMDRRSAAEADALVQAFGRERLQHITGLIPDTEFSASKILWLRAHLPEVFCAARLYLQPRDYLYFRLTGAPATDYTLASQTMLLDVGRRSWWEDGCVYVGVTPAAFPPIYPSASAPCGIDPEAADALGIPAGTPVALGGGDRPCEVLGCGAAAGWVMVSTGTTTNVSAAVEGRPAEVDSRVMCSLHVVNGMSVLEQRMSASGAMLRWLRDRLLGDLDYRSIDALAAAVPPGADHLLFLPFMMGARATRWNPEARGVWFGLTEAHGKGTLARSVMEGVAYELHACLDVLAAMGLPFTGIFSVGAGARSALWNQIYADVLEREVRVPRQTDAASLGAMLLAASAAGHLADVVNAARSANPVAAAFRPNAAAANRYRALYAEYNTLYEALRPAFPDLAAEDAIAGDRSRDRP